MKTTLPSLKKLTKEVKAKSIGAISLKIPPHSHCTANILSLMYAINELCVRQAIHLHICTIKELKGANYEANNKKVLIQKLAHKYPILVPYAHRELTNRHKHYTKMFEAVAAAELLLKRNSTIL